MAVNGRTPAVRYGGEDPANAAPRFCLGAAAWCCVCFATDDLVLLVDRFFCRPCLKRYNAAGALFERREVVGV